MVLGSNPSGPTKSRTCGILIVEAHGGFRVVLAEDGACAAELFAARPGAFAVVVTDLDMPVLDGPAFARRPGSWR